MKWVSKVTRILWKTLVFSGILIAFLLGTLYVVFQIEAIQTWTAQQVAKYMSHDLGTKISIGKVKISFIKNVTLEDVFVGDRHNDTLLIGKSIKVDVSEFNYGDKKFSIDEAELTNIKVKVLKYKNEQDFNFQFLADYFASKDTTPLDTVPSPWKIKYGALVLKNVDFTYRLLRDTDKVGEVMNYNNLHASRIYGKISDIHVDEDTIQAQITNLSAYEQCGIHVKRLTTKLKLSPTLTLCEKLYLKTDNSCVKGTFAFRYTNWEDYLDFTHKVYMKAHLEDSTNLHFKDIAYFAEDLKGFHETIDITGKIRGYINDLSGSGLWIKYRRHTEFKGDFSITGLPDIHQSYIHFDAKKLSTAKSDLEKLPLPPFDQTNTLHLPKELDKLGIVSYQGKFDGFINNFATYGTFKTDIGTIKTDIQLNNTGKIVAYSGIIRTTNFNFSKLFSHSQTFGPVSLNANVKGKGFTLKELDAKMEGLIQSISYNHYTYTNLKIDGLLKNKVFEGTLISRDTSADFDFNGAVDFNHKVPKIDFISTINHLDLQKTHLATSKLNGSLSSQVFINLNGDDIDNLTGLINFDNTIYKTNNKAYTLSTFNLSLDQTTPLKTIHLTSSILNAKLTGKYKLSTLPDACKQYLNTYFPTFVKTNTRYVYNDKAELTVKVKNFRTINELFLNDLMISPNTQIEGSFDAAISYLYLKTNSDIMEYAGIKFKKNTININSLPNGISLSYLANSIHVTDSFAFKNMAVTMIANDKTSDFKISWDNRSSPSNKGDIEGRMKFMNDVSELSLHKFTSVVEDSLWQMATSNTITFDTAFFITVNPMTFYNQNQTITFDGRLSNNVNDQFNARVQHFQLSQFNPLLAASKTTLDGILNGDVTMYGVFGKTIINSRIDFNRLKVNNRLVGSGEVKSEYDPEKEIVNISGYSAFAQDFDGNPLKNVQFKGYYLPKKKEDNLDLSFKAEPLDIALLQPLLKDILTVKVGYLNGSGRITGSPKTPLINAQLKFFKCVMQVDFSNVQYSVNGNVEITPAQIKFEQIELRDKMGNTGIVDGNIFHNNFKNIRIDFDINTNKLMLLNTTSANNPSYYGTAYASGNAGLYGFLDDIKMEINMKTNGGTYFYIPLDGPSEINNNDFIRFVTKDTIKKIVKTTPSNFSLDFNLEATPDAEVQLIFDAKSGDIIKARGAGNLNMKINSKGKFDMYGDYVLSSGDYLFTLENFVTKKFEIQKGSAIKWNGNVYKANIDITAIYRQRASLRPIYPSDSSGKRYTVDCKLYMKDKLTAPDITFGIDLPTVDENTRSTVKSILNDENELNRQVFALLLLRSFITPVSASGGGGITAGGAAANTGSEMLSNKLSNWLNGVTKDIDVGVNYRPGTGITSDELDLTLNKQLFNNRLVFDGNFGVNNTSTKNANNTNTSNLIGDVTLEYKLTDSGKYRVKGFNRSNDNTQVLNSGGPFTQGVGIFYREEFENLNELYKRYLNKFKKSSMTTP